ncbi:signal recognition particle 14kD protein-domain-containing protein [Mycena floridula]|nr:signal recognition particle 14kD protein-domain-containing protein [Mycena floridula]
MLVENDNFLKKLSELFVTTQGSIWITHKRLIHDGEDALMNDQDREYKCLLRATDGKEVKLSTEVTSAELPKFNAAYGALLKASMTTLRKRDKKREKMRAEQIVKKKKRAEMAQQAVIEGAKRGAGRAARQRKVKAVEKLKARQEAKAKAAGTVPT